MDVENQPCQGIDITDAGPQRERLPGKKHSSKAAWYDDVFVFYCTAVYLADVITDILVSIKYFRQDDYIWFSLTLACIVGASLVMNLFSLKWFYDDTAEEVSKTKTIIIHLFQLGPLQRYWQAYRNGRKTRTEQEKSSEYYDIFIEQWRDITMLRLFEAFIESAPQMVLQLYILAYKREFDIKKDWLTTLSACSSLLSLSTSIVSYSKALRDARANKGKMTWWAFGCQLVWRISMVASRVITLVLFASVYKSWILLVIGLHWVPMVVWVHRQKATFCSGKKHLERFFSVVIGFIYIFCFFNTKDGFTRTRLVIFYIVMLIENCVLMALWLPYRHEYGVVFVIAVAWVFGGFFLGVIAMLLYYQYYHPSLQRQGLCWRTSHNDVPHVEEIVYRYFCCGNCCHIRYHKEPEISTSGSNILIDIPASRGSVGRSVAKTKDLAPFEKELFQHEPSLLQRRHSLEKHRLKQRKVERARKMHEEENGIQNATELGGELQTNGVSSPESRSTDVTMNANSSFSGSNEQKSGVYEDNGENEERFGIVDEKSGTDVVKNETCENGLHCGTDEEEETRTSVPRRTICDDGLHCGTDEEKETRTSVPRRTICDDGLHCGTDDEEGTRTSVPRRTICDDGLHCGTDDEEETRTSVPRRTICDDGLHCGTDDEEETRTSVPRRTICDDGLHCGTDDEEGTRTSVPRRTICDDGLHCGTDEEKETRTSVPRRTICDDGLHCGTDDEEETRTSVPRRTICDDGLHCGTDEEEETRTSVPRRTICDDGLHCGTDDEEETGTSLVKKNTCKDGLHCVTDGKKKTRTGMSPRKTCDDGLHCGTDDEEDTETSVVRKTTCKDGLHCGINHKRDTRSNMLKTTTCDNGLHCGSDDDEETKTGIEKRKPRKNGLHSIDDKTRTCLLKTKACELKKEENKRESLSHLDKLLSNNSSLSLSFSRRYSIVSDCISLSSSSETTEDEDVQQNEDSGDARCENGVEEDTNNNPGDSSPRRKTSPRRSKHANKVTFPNFVASNLSRGRFSSLRVSSEDVVEEEGTNVITEKPCRSSENKYWRLLQRLKPKRFGSVRDPGSSFVGFGKNETAKDLCVQVGDNKGDRS